MVNLSVDLPDERFGTAALHEALRAIETLGFTVERGRGGDAFLAWLDDEFGGTWSSEAFAGESVIARKDGRFAGFATYDPRGLRFKWLRGLGAREGTGIFGPFGVAREFRKSGIGPHLLAAAIGSLQERGYRTALIPAVGDDKLIAYYQTHAGASVAEQFDRGEWFKRRYRTVVLASGNGSNFQAVLDRANDGRLPLEITALVCNRPGAYCLERAQTANVRGVVHPWIRKESSRLAYDERLLELVGNEAPDLVLLLGWMHLLSPAFIDAFTSINIHPAFLPLDQRQESVTYPDGFTGSAFRGAAAVADALASNSRWTGASAHVVSNEADRGPVLTRKPMPIAPGEDAAAVMQRLHPLEHITLSGGIMRWVFEQ
ncbi:MAG TPA: GNAT family N-acetyltransferase [Candidatus Baltobacteraceae bacterium]|nr:GNAT family N-acetyltransferase [Candidatus Baltobacteraceae bacterium]